MSGLQGRWGQSVQIVSIRFPLTGTRSWPALLKTLDILFHWSAKGKKVKSGGFKEHTCSTTALFTKIKLKTQSLPLSFQPLLLTIPLRKTAKSTAVTAPQTCHSGRYRTSQSWSLMLELKKNCSSWETEVSGRSHCRSCPKGVPSHSAELC